MTDPQILHPLLINNSRKIFSCFSRTISCPHLDSITRYFNVTQGRQKFYLKQTLHLLNQYYGPATRLGILSTKMWCAPVENAEFLQIWVLIVNFSSNFWTLGALHSFLRNPLGLPLELFARSYSSFLTAGRCCSAAWLRSGCVLSRCWFVPLFDCDSIIFDDFHVSPVCSNSPRALSSAHYKKHELLSWSWPFLSDRSVCPSPRLTTHGALHQECISGAPIRWALWYVCFLEARFRDWFIALRSLFRTCLFHFRSLAPSSRAMN